MPSELLGVVIQAKLLEACTHVLRLGIEALPSGGVLWVKVLHVLQEFLVATLLQNAHQTWEKSKSQWQHS